MVMSRVSSPPPATTTPCATQRTPPTRGCRAQCAITSIPATSLQLESGESGSDNGAAVSTPCPSAFPADVPFCLIEPRCCSRGRPPSPLKARGLMRQLPACSVTRKSAETSMRGACGGAQPFQGGTPLQVPQYVPSFLVRCGSHRTPVCSHSVSTMPLPFTAWPHTPDGPMRRCALYVLGSGLGGCDLLLHKFWAPAPLPTRGTFASSTPPQVVPPVAALTRILCSVRPLVAAIRCRASFAFLTVAEQWQGAAHHPLSTCGAAGWVDGRAGGGITT